MSEIRLLALGSSFFIIGLIMLEIKRFNTLLTPFVFLAAPFVVIINLVNFGLQGIGFPPVTIRAQLLIYLSLIVYWLIGFIVSKFFNIKDFKFKKIKTLFSDEFKDFDLILIFVSWIVIIFVFKKVFSLFAAHGGFSYFGNQEYEKIMIRGLVAHLVQVGKVSFIVLFFIYKKSKYKKIILLTLIFLGIAIASTQIKYAIMFPIVMVFLYYNFEKTIEKQFKTLILFVLGLFLIMNLFWLTLTIAWGTFGFSHKGVWEFFYKETLNYFVTGPIILDYWMNFPQVKPDWALLVVFRNLYHVIINHPKIYNMVPLVSMEFHQTARGLYSNVATAFGTYYLIGGVVFNIFMNIFTSAITYLVYYLNLKKYSPYLMWINLLLLTMTLFTFFGVYFTLLSMYEMTFIFFIFIMIFRTFKYINQLIRE